MPTPEQKTQLAICDWILKQHPEVFNHVIKIDNEGKRTVGGHMLAKRMGLHKGASDLLIAWTGSGFPGAFIEIKPDNWKGPYGVKAKKHHAEQMAFIEKMLTQGYYAKMIIGTDEGIAAVKAFLKGK